MDGCRRTHNTIQLRFVSCGCCGATKPSYGIAACTTPNIAHGQYFSRSGASKHFYVHPSQAAAPTNRPHLPQEPAGPAGSCQHVLWQATCARKQSLCCIPQLPAGNSAPEIPCKQAAADSLIPHPSSTVPAAAGAAAAPAGATPAANSSDPSAQDDASNDLGEEDEPGKPSKNGVPATPLPPCCAALPPGFPYPGIPVVIIDTQGTALQVDKPKVSGAMCTCGAPGE